jgi:hypothetical protein
MVTKMMLRSACVLFSKRSDILLKETMYFLDNDNCVVHARNWQWRNRLLYMVSKNQLFVTNKGKFCWVNLSSKAQSFGDSSWWPPTSMEVLLQVETDHNAGGLTCNYENHCLVTKQIRIRIMWCDVRYLSMETDPEVAIWMKCNRNTIKTEDGEGWRRRNRAEETVYSRKTMPWVIFTAR